MLQTPKSKTGQLAELLRQRLAAGEWRDCLPSERMLADEYLVSRTTLRQAVAILVEEGRIGAATSTRSGRKLKPGNQRRGPVQVNQAIVLTPSLAGSPILLEQLAVLRELLGSAGIQVRVHEAGALADQERTEPGLRRLLVRRPGAVWILHRMPRGIQEWFAHSKTPAVVFGSTFRNIELPSVDVDFGAVARHATGLCLARGFRNFTLLVNRTNLAGDLITVEALTDELRRSGAPPPRIMRHDFNRARLTDGLDHVFLPRRSRKEVLLISNQHHLLTALSHLLHRGVRIPEDLSVICLSNDPAIERLSPLPCRYDSGTALVRKLAAAVKGLTEGVPPASHRILPKLIKGETFRSA